MRRERRLRPVLVAVAIVLASLSAWFAARTELRNQVDGLLRNQAAGLQTSSTFRNRSFGTGFRLRPFIDGHFPEFILLQGVQAQFL